MPLLKRPVCLQSQSASGYVPRTILQFNWTRDQLIQHFNHYNHILGLRWYLPCALHISDHISLEVMQNRIKFVNSSCSHIGDVIFVGVMIVSISLSLAPSSNCLCTFFVYVTRLCFRKKLLLFTFFMTTDHFALLCFDTVGWAMQPCKYCPRNNLLSPIVCWLGNDG